MEQIAFQIGEEFLDLLPGTELELEEDNPFIQLGDEVVGPFTFPFDVPNTEKNIRLLQLVTLINSVKVGKIDNVILWQNGIQHSVGTLRVENVNGDLNDMLAGTSSLYYLTGSSSFWQAIEDKDMHLVDCGGTRSFPQLSIDITSGWWKHVDDAMRGNSDTFDYAFFPIKNPGITFASNGNTGPGYMNRVVVSGGSVRISAFGTTTNYHNALYPFPYLVYVIKRIFAFAGWTVDGDFFNDPDIKKITIISNRDIAWGWRFSTLFDIVLRSTVTFDLADHLPDTTIGAFLVAWKNKLGLYYDFDNRRKHCTIRFVDDVIGQEIEDITRYCRAKYGNTIEADTKLYRFVQGFDSGDSYPSKSDMRGMEIIGVYETIPGAEATAANQGKLCLVLLDNAYYICQENESSAGVYYWLKYMDNIYDLEPEGFNADITTDVTTTIMEWVNEGGIEGLMPAVNQAATWTVYNNNEVSIGIRALFYHGMQPDLNGMLYPYASNHPINSQGNLVGGLSLSYEFQHPDMVEDIGIYNRFWKRFITAMKQRETITVDVNYPFSRLNTIGFGSIKIVNHTKFFVKKKTSILPYNGALKLELIKV